MAWRANLIVRKIRDNISLCKFIYLYIYLSFEFYPLQRLLGSGFGGVLRTIQSILNRGFFQIKRKGSWECIAFYVVLLFSLKLDF